MQSIIQEKLYQLSEMEKNFYPLIRNSVFHFTSDKKLNSIIDSDGIFPSGYSSEIYTTSIYSNKSMGKALAAVCLFDLRNKTDEQIAPGQSFYNFLQGKVGSRLVYLELDKRYHGNITTIDKVDENLRKERMYLPEIESWYVGKIELSMISNIYVVSII
jgi:hypothetical protein